MRSEAKIQEELNALTLYGTEADAITAWVDAFHNYMLEAECNSVPANSVALETCKAPMAAVMQTIIEDDVVTQAGISLSGASAIASGISAYWTTFIAAFATIFPGSISGTPPPALGTLGGLLTTTFNSNQSGSKSKLDSMNAIGSDIHTVCTGGSGTFPPSLVFPIL